MQASVYTATSTAHNVQIPHSAMSWTDMAKLPVDFVTTLTEPFTGEAAQRFYMRQWTQIRENGLTSCVWQVARNVGHAVKEHPLDAVCLTGGIFLGCASTENSLTPLAALVTTTAVSVKNGKSVKSIADSIDGSTLARKTIKVVIISGAIIYVFSNIPTAAALEWNSVADAKAHYSGEQCADDPWKDLMTPASQCVREGGSLQRCRDFITDQTETDLYVFTRHPTSEPGMDPVSITKLHVDQTCFLSALGKTSDVTKVCFPNLSDPSIRTTERLDGMILQDAHQGVGPGQSVQHIGMRRIQDGRQCGFFHNTQANNDVGGQPTCLLTSLKKSGDVSQICFDPKSPESLTLKKAAGISLDNQGDTPVSIVIQNPKALQLDVEADRGEITCDTELGKQNGFTLWEALSWWWRQKTPCEDAVQDPK